MASSLWLFRVKTFSRNSAAHGLIPIATRDIERVRKDTKWFCGMLTSKFLIIEQIEKTPVTQMLYRLHYVYIKYSLCILACETLLKSLLELYRKILSKIYSYSKKIYARWKLYFGNKKFIWRIDKQVIVFARISNIYCYVLTKIMTRDKYFSSIFMFYKERIKCFIPQWQTRRNIIYI